MLYLHILLGVFGVYFGGVAFLMGRHHWKMHKERALLRQKFDELKSTRESYDHK